MSVYFEWISEKMINFSRIKAESIFGKLKKFETKEWLFQSGIYSVPLILLILSLQGWIDKSIYFGFNTFIFPFYLVLGLFIYKKINNSSRFELFRALVLFILILKVVSFTTTVYALRADARLPMLIISEILVSLGSLIILLFTSLGLVTIFYPKDVNWREFAVFILIGLLSSSLSYFIILNMNQSNFSYNSIIPVLIASINFALYFNAFKVVSKYLTNKYFTPVIFFVCLAATIYFLFVVVGILNVYSTNNHENLRDILIFNIPFVTQYLIAGGVIFIYQKLMFKDVNH